MAQVEALDRDKPRWRRTLHSTETFSDDIGELGTWVGPRTGPSKRSHGEKEDYALRRLLVAWRARGLLRFPVEVLAECDAKGQPDFTLAFPDGRTRGIEVTEAGEEDYQRWLTAVEAADRAEGKAGVHHVPFDDSMERTVDEIIRAVERKNETFDDGAYRQPAECDLLVYDNAPWGGFDINDEVIAEVASHNHLSGRFREIHLISGGKVWLDMLDRPERVDLRNDYEIDLVAWAFDQAEKLRGRRANGIDWANLAEELEALGKSDKRGLSSHLRNLILHLLNWQFQPSKRSRSREASIGNARDEIQARLLDTPSLRNDLTESVASSYSRARKRASREARLPIHTFPESCPYSLEQLMDDDFLPGDQT